MKKQFRLLVIAVCSLFAMTAFDSNDDDTQNQMPKERKNITLR